MTQSQETEHGRLSGSRLVVARAVWIVLAILFAGGFASGLPARFQAFSQGQVGIDVEQNEAGLLSVIPQPGWPAEEMGLRPGDVLLAIDGSPIQAGSSLEDVRARLAGEIGTQLALTIRDGIGAAHAYTLTRSADVSPALARLGLSTHAFVQLGLSASAYAWYRLLPPLIVVLGFVLAGLLIWRQADEWFELFVSLGLVVLGSAVGYKFIYLYGIAPAEPLIQLANFLGAAFFLLFFFLFPDGRFVPAWSRGVGVLAVAYAWALMYLPAPYNPAVWPSPMDFIPGLALYATGVYAQFYRYRRVSNPLQRQQTKWIVAALSTLIGLAVCVALFFFSQLARLLPGLALSDYEMSLAVLFFWIPLGMLGLFTLPVAIGFSSLRYRLWDVDVVVNRSLVYGTLTAALGLIYLASVSLLQWLFQIVTNVRSSTPAIAVSTLVIVVLSRPVHRRVQDGIDRRFYRHKVDLAREMVVFSRQVRTMLDLSELLQALLACTSELSYARYGAVFLHGPGGLRLAEAHGRLPEGTAGLALDGRQQALLQAGAAVAQPGEAGFPLLLPLLAPRAQGSQLVGVLALGPRLSERGYSSEEQALLMGGVEQVGSAIHVAQLVDEKRRYDKLLCSVIDMAVMLSGEKQFERLLERILLEAKTLCNADAGTLYLRTEDDQLAFAIVRNDSLKLALGGTTGADIPFSPLPLYDERGQPNAHNVATQAALSGASINVPDAYSADGFDFSGTRAFDAQTGYRSQAFLSVPLKDEAGQAIGVLQLINARDKTGRVIPFEAGLQGVVESLAALAALTLAAYLREQKLRQEIQELQIEIDQAKQARQVAEITETEYFRTLSQRARELRKKPPPCASR